MRKSKTINKLLFIVALTGMLSSCGKEVLIDSSMETGKSGWPATQIFKVEFEQQDTILKYNFYITLRNTEEYPYQNLYVFLSTVYPDGSSSRDTINCPITDYRGKWLGQGFGGVYDNRILYRAKSRFTRPGIYKIEMQQAMRTDTLAGVVSAGIRIEKAE